MKDPLPSTRRSLQSSWFHTSIELPQVVPKSANPFNFAHLPRDLSSTLGSHDVPLSMMNPVGNLTTEAIATVLS